MVGGRKTQRSIVTSWNACFGVILFISYFDAYPLQIFQTEALAAGKLRDNIVDEHVLLIDFCAERCK